MSSPPSHSTTSAPWLSKLFQRARSPSMEQGADQHEPSGNAVPAQTETIPRYARPRAESSLVAGSFSSSLIPKTPARSYYHRSFHGSFVSQDTLHNTARNVRKDTAALASWALSDTGESMSTRQSSGTVSLHRTSTDHSGGAVQQDPFDTSELSIDGQPGVLPKVSEPS